MEVLQSRADSFKTKRVQNPVKPSSSVNLKWPHPRRFNASPAALAEAGFFFNPSYEDRDSVTCFYCDKQLSHWEAEDDPFDIHWEKCRTTCCWAIVRCGLRGDMDSHRRFVSADKSRLPTSKNMEQARLGTFQVGNGWIHDQVEDHGANSRKMARAGFVYTPQHEGDDLATCLYCEVSLGGWDAEDDPMEEHNKRGNKSGQQCAFLATLEFTAMTTTPASRSLSQSKPSSKSTQSKSKHKDIVLLTKTHDGELEDDSEGGVPPAASAKKSTRGRSTSSSTRSASGSSRSTKAATTVGKTPKKHTRSQSRGGFKDVNEDVEDAEEEREPESIPAKTRRTTAAVAKTSRSRSKSVSRPIPGAFPGDEEEIEEVVEKKSVKDRSKAKEEACIEGDGEVEEVKVLKKSTRGKPKAKIEGDEAEEVANLKKSTRGRPKTRIASTEEEPVEEDEGERASRKPSRTKSKAKPEPEQEPEEDVEEMAKSPSKARPKTIAPVTRKPSRTKPKPPVVEELEDVEETLPTPAVPVIPKKTRTASSSANPKARSTSKPKPNARLMEVEDVVLDGAMEADEMDVFVHTHPSPPPEPPSPPPVLSNEKEREGLSEPEELSPLVIPKRSVKGKGKYALVEDQQGKEDSRADGQGTAPKAKEKQKNIDKALPTTAVGESSEEAPEPRRSKKPPPKATSSREIPAKVQAPTGDVEKIKIKKAGNARKGIKVVEISTDEEIGDDDMKDEAQHGRSTTNQRVETLKSKPEEKDPFLETAAQSSKSGAPWPPSPTHTTTKTPIKEPEDVEMPGADDDLRIEDQQPQIHIEQDQEDPPKTPPLGRTNDPLSQSDPLPASAPTLIFPPLSKLPFTPIQNLSEAELDMTVEEWIRYQMEVEYDKFRRDGERELGRFKQRAEEVRRIIKSL